MKKIKNICCIGAGYVGGPTMAVMALKNPQINFHIVDLNQDRINSWNSEDFNNLPIYEPGLSNIIKKIRGKNLFFSTEIKSSIKKSEIIFIAVNTPTKTFGEGKGMASNLKYVESCVDSINKYSKGFKIIVEKSTVPVKTGEKIKKVLNKNKNCEFEVISNPEFLAEGSAIKDMLSPDRILIGGDSETKKGSESIKILSNIYEKWVPKNKILITNLWSSELAKLSSNAMLAQRISSINSLSALCEKTGANIKELSRAIGMDKRIGKKFLKASPGFGGSCFQKDILSLIYISKYYGLNEVAEYWTQVIKINDYQRTRIAKNIIESFKNDLHNPKILILGWAFKANTDDSRESSSIKISEKLYSMGAKISIYDPHVPKKVIKDDIDQKWEIKLKKNIDILSSLKDYDFNKGNQFDAIVILTEWEEFKYINFPKSSRVFDCRDILQKKDIYYSLGIKN